MSAADRTHVLLPHLGRAGPMSSLRAVSLRAVAFGDLGLDRWGAVLRPGGGLPSFAVLGGERATVIPVALEGDASPEAEWWVTGEGLDLAVAPEAAGEAPDAAGEAAEASADTASTHPQHGFDQLVTVRGEFPGDGALEVDFLGCRSERDQELEAGKFELFRDVRAWFSSREGLALIAVRPRRASSHGDERLTATLFEGGPPLRVAEPRLSTTYADDGLPVRATLELWLPESDEEDEEVVSYPRRASGEAAGPGMSHDFGQLQIHARPFRWRAAGRDGAGVYVLAQAR